MKDTIKNVLGDNLVACCCFDYRGFRVCVSTITGKTAVAFQNKIQTELENASSAIEFINNLTEGL